MSERRFSESEIREVFERAAREQHAAHRNAQEGLTLAEMQDVAASAGIDPAFVASAARSVSLGEPETGRLAMGPVARGVFRTEFLPGPPTSALWEQIVADCRRTFRAQGKATVVGSSHEWRNGNLIVTLDPAGDGSRLHMRTRRSDVGQLVGMAGALMLVGLFAALASTTNAGFDPDGMAAWLVMILVGALGGVGVWARQRSWAATRERQMSEIAERSTTASVPLSPASIEAPAAPARIDLDALSLDDPEAEGVRPGARTRTR